ncbi:MAG: ABC-ATPase UvrA, partial [Eubacterium sp.]
ELGLSQAEVSFVVPYLLDAKTKIKRLCAIGLGYLSLDRQTMTLSGGEAQRVRLSGALDSEMTGIIYIMDEPTIGLHPQDTRGMISILKKLRDKGNAVIVIEHDRDVMEAADFMVDMGPGAGRYGGNIIGTGTFEAIKKQVNSVTGGFFSRVSGQGKRVVRPSDGGVIVVENACRFNLKQINVSFLTGCLTCVTGVSGSGKSTLIFEVLAKGGSDVEQVTGLSVFDRIVTVEQAQITRMRRSNVATYSEVYGGIRKIFGGLPESKEKGLTVKDFSFNSKGGRCENCEGLGSIVSNMLFFEDLEVVCPVCGGKQFNDVVLSVRYKGLN